MAIFATESMLTKKRSGGGDRKSLKYADVIYEWFLGSSTSTQLVQE